MVAEQVCVEGETCKENSIVRAVDKREYLVIIRDNFCQFCTKNLPVCCDPSSESSHRDGSDEASQHNMVSMRNLYKKLIPQILLLSRALLSAMTGNQTCDPNI